MTTKIREYEYLGRIIGRVLDYGQGEREFVTDLTEMNAVDLIQDMPIRHKIRMRSEAFGVLKLAQHFRIPIDSYLTNEDLAIYIMGLGCQNLTELNHTDQRAWQLLHDRGLAKKFFPDLIESDYNGEHK